MVVLLILFGGGGFYFGGPVIGGSALGLILLICLVIYFMGGFRASKSQQIIQPRVYPWVGEWGVPLVERGGFTRSCGANAKHQTTKPSAMTKLEEFGILLAANGEQARNPNTVETGSPPPSVPPAKAEISIGTIAPL